MIKETVTIRTLGLQDYAATWQAMKDFTQHRNEHSCDEIWQVEHLPIFTQGQNGKAEHILNPGEIPIVPIDRGGQITYHGPGQILLYTLIDVKRKQLNVRQLVSALEASVIALLASYQITAHAKSQAPGVYIHEKKICSIGLRIRRGCSYHGLALNVDMDLEPFTRINPCGFAALKMTQLSEYIRPSSIQQIGLALIEHLCTYLGYTRRLIMTEPWHGP
jgi:lipoyl(octanoyl) transferase